MMSMFRARIASPYIRQLRSGLRTTSKEQIDACKNYGSSNELIGTAYHRIPDDHAVAVDATAQELIGGAPEVKAEAAIVEVAETLVDCSAAYVDLFGIFEGRVLSATGILRREYEPESPPPPWPWM